MNVNAALDKIDRLQANGFTLTDAEINAVLNSGVKTSDAEVIRYGVMLARVADSNMLLINNLDFGTSIGPAMGIDRKFVTPSAFAMYTLGKDICETLYGGTIVAKDSEFINNLEHIEEHKAQRELIKKNLYALVYDKNNKALITYGLSRISGNTVNNADVFIDVSELSESEIVILRNDVDKHCSLRIRAGKFPTLSTHLKEYTVFKCALVDQRQIFEPLIVPGKMTQMRLKAFRRR